MVYEIRNISGDIITKSTVANPFGNLLPPINSTVKFRNFRSNEDYGKPWFLIIGTVTSIEFSMEEGFNEFYKNQKTTVYIDNVLKIEES